MIIYGVAKNNGTFGTVTNASKVKDYGTTKICERKPLK
ncbi:hypothetical protein CGSMWGv1500E_00335 [Gardnerella vaginalis 1500E]|uniref:Uncharacterized protein n=1 Tax=Gardnerella vaginalis 1500E TaxID=698957 RepID=I4M4J6_GARVA|nr:hypothetical protein CGSMWGv1500E_00335 [Gardnerella vaginalis 1500E]